MTEKNSRDYSLLETDVAAILNELFSKSAFKGNRHA